MTIPAHAEGFTAGHAEGMTAAADVVAEAERAAAARLADVQARWERRVASATAAHGAAVTRLDEASLPLADEVRETVIGTVLTLVEDLVGRELALAEDPVLDAVRRALALVPSDAPAVIRVHPDDLAEIPVEALAEHKPFLTGKISQRLIDAFLADRKGEKEALSPRERRVERRGSL